MKLSMINDISLVLPPCKLVRMEDEIHDKRRWITQSPKASKKAVNAQFKMFKEAFSELGVEYDHRIAWDIFMHICAGYEAEASEPATELDVNYWRLCVEMELSPVSATGDWRTYEEKLSDAVDSYFSDRIRLYEVDKDQYGIIKAELTKYFKSFPEPKASEQLKFGGAQHLELILRRNNIRFTSQVNYGKPKKFWV